MSRKLMSLEESRKKFEYCHKSGNFKYKYLPEWLEFKSEKFKNHLDGNRPKTFFHLKRGTLVYAMLGVNLGTEFSGNHFCITLDHIDNVKKETVTVIPLSSKYNKFYVELEDNVVDRASESIGHEIDKLQEELNESKKYLKVMEESHKKSGEILDRLDARDDIPENDITDLRELNQTFVDARKTITTNDEKYQKKISQLRTLIRRYSKLKGKKTYAHINGITTISKQKLIRFNELDPTARVQFNDDSMKAIDKEIKRRFLSN